MRILGKTGLKICEIGFGGIPIQNINKEQTKELFCEMERVGINFIDTARGYTISEELIGYALEGKREKFILATKSMSRSYEGMKNDIEISLQNMKTNYIDLYQLHNVSLNEDITGAIKALEEAKNNNLIGHIGITTHSAEVLEREVNLNRFETIQFPYNIVESQGEKFFEKAKDNNIGIIVMKPLAGGAIDKPKVALKYILDNPNISVAIPGMDTVEKVLENVSVIGKKLTEEEQKEVINIKESLQGDFCRRCGYCMPCPIGINIPLVFLCEGYYERYGLKEWAKSRYNSMKAKASECIKCGKCESKCPYNLKIREKLEVIAKVLEEENE